MINKHPLLMKCNPLLSFVVSNTGDCIHWVESQCLRFEQNRIRFAQIRMDDALMAYWNFKIR